MRRVFLGPHQQGRMHAIARAGGVNLTTQAGDRYGGIVPAIVYTSLLQAGVDGIELSSGFEPSGALPQFGGRLKIIGINAWGKANSRILPAFQHLPQNGRELDMTFLLSLTGLMNFLTELMNALDTRCHVGWMDQIPTSELCDELLPTALATPVGNLLSTLRIVEPF